MSIILAEYSDFPPLSNTHPTDYYFKLTTGGPTSPPFSTRDPVNPASLFEYFLENSNNRFVLGPALLGNVQLGPTPSNDISAEQQFADVLRLFYDESKVNVLVGGDINEDGQVGPDEQCVLIVRNITGAWPLNRVNNPVTFALQPRDETLVTRCAGVGPTTPFYQIAHEMSHSLGTVDLYDSGVLPPNANNMLLTLMGAYSFTSDDQGTVHLDIWHKLALGWAEPRIFDLSVHGETHVDTTADGAVLLWHPTREAREYFLIERRGPALPGRKYDASFPDDGVLIWRVQGGMPTHLGAPYLTPGGPGVWHVGQKTPLLIWNDGDLTRVQISVTEADDGKLHVAWHSPVTLRKDAVGPFGPFVKQLQRSLNDLVPGDPIAIDGVFGPITESRVREFQRRAGITDDGVVEMQTWGAITKLAPRPGDAGTPTLRKGSQGVAVMRLQQLLSERTPDLAPIAVDGDFGPITDGRVREFQRRTKITVDGLVGPQTWGSLFHDPALQQGSQGPAVMRLQRLLNERTPDLAPIAVDGDFGPITDGRVREFQRRTNITVDGLVGPQTWEALTRQDSTL
ncbi:peptidoglycan-binding protein [Streptomyces chartreusis]|uniref:Peptidoglycan-binding protein n=1 Tax=Streptomyces chartreusis TaxID=1969 RepID=A0A7H8TFA1_STRCX|nr:peptidoglycan-binding protein [Streptomyces chartreusis]QKZ21718.1 peptidoglycan-binding protein [Streptomyces chartreusis]